MQTKLLWIGASSPITESELNRTVHGLAVVHEPSLPDALQRLNSGEYGLVILSLAPLGDSGEQALEELLHHDRRFPVIVHHPEGTIDDAIRLTRHGAFYVLLGDSEPQRVEHAVKMALERSRPKNLPELHTLPWRHSVIGQSRAIQHILEVIQLIASKRATVLISGETGTGKEVVAKAIHAASNRAARAMVSVNCTALPVNLIETELFGHAKGAFTGAHGSRIGRFEQANRSTIFLDEIGDLPLDSQSKLLRVLQEQEFQRVGSSETVHVDVRVIAASNVDLEDAVRERRFREDLFYRLNVVPIRIPPLRERRDDIAPLLDHFLEKIRAAEEGPSKRISPEAIDLLTSLDWPGNVRQLEHAVHMAYALSGDRRILFPGDFSANRPAQVARAADASANADPAKITIPNEGIDFDEVVGSFELSLLNQALTASGGNKARAADLLRIKRTTLLAKMKTFEERGATPARKGPVAVPSRPTALVFEQDGPVRKLIAKTLEEEGYRVMEAASGSIAMDLFEAWKTHITLIVSAAAKSEPHSEDVTARLRSLAPALPMILICDHRHGLSDEREHANTETLVRPFSAEELISALKEMISRRTSTMAGAFCA